MGYNRSDYVKIKAEYSEKYRIAREKADDRRFELYVAIPEVKEIDSILASTGSEIMNIITSATKNPESKVAELRARNDELLQKRTGLRSPYISRAR